MLAERLKEAPDDGGVWRGPEVARVIGQQLGRAVDPARETKHTGVRDASQGEWAWSRRHDVARGTQSTHPGSAGRRPQLGGVVQGAGSTSCTALSARCLQGPAHTRCRGAHGPALDLL